MRDRVCVPPIMKVCAQNRRCVGHPKNTHGYFCSALAKGTHTNTYVPKQKANSSCLLFIGQFQTNKNCRKTNIDKQTKE